MTVLSIVSSHGFVDVGGFVLLAMIFAPSLPPFLSCYCVCFLWTSLLVLFKPPPHPPRVYTLRTNWTLLTALIFTHTACRSLEVVLIFPDYSISLKCEWICKLESRLSNENFIIKGCNDPLPLPLFIFLSSSYSFSSLSIFFVHLLISMFYKFLRIGTTRIILLKGSIPFLFQIS